VSEDEEKRDYRKGSPWKNDFLYPLRHRRKKPIEPEEREPEAPRSPAHPIRIRLPEDESIYTRTIYIESPHEPMPREPEPWECRDIATLSIHLCRTAHEQGWQKCTECAQPCKWGLEYMRRMNGGRRRDRRPRLNFDK